MKISTKGRYGLRALLDMAAHADETTTLANIAERQSVSLGYLEQIFSTLRKAGIVIGTKGPQGGYALAQPADRLEVQTILDVLEGDLFTITDDPADTTDGTAMQAVIRTHVWDCITGAASAALAGLTLGALAEAYEQSRNTDGYIFYI